MIDLDLCCSPLDFPRSLWPRLGVVLHLIGNRAHWQIQQLIEGLSYHPDMTEALLALFEKALGTLARVSHGGRIDVSLFGFSEAASIFYQPGGGRVGSHPFRLLGREGLRHLEAVFTEYDLVLLLSGAARFDSLALVRALHVAEIFDMADMPRLKHESGEGFSTLIAQESGRKVFANRYPFRSVYGLNLLITPEFLPKIRSLNGLFESTYQTGCRLGYRAGVQGAIWPLLLPCLTDFDNHRGEPTDEALFRSQAPKHWDMKHDGCFRAPKVSVYVPSHNATKYIESTVDCVLEQDDKDLDVSIANDGSRYGALDLLMRRYDDNPQVRILNNPKGGSCFTSNGAIRTWHSLYIGQFDSDDCLKPYAALRLITYLDDHPDVVCAYGSCERIDAEGRYLKDEYTWPVFAPEKILVTSIAHRFGLFRRQAWNRRPGFRQDIVNGADYDAFLEMAETGALHHVDKMLHQRRWHGENTSKVSKDQQTACNHWVQRETLKHRGMDQHRDIHVPDHAQPRCMIYQLNPSTQMVVFWPDCSRANPYQKLLCRDLRQKAEVVSGTIEAVLKPVADKVVVATDLIFRLHWLNVLVLDCETQEEARSAANDLLAKVEKIIWKGARFVRTIDNTVSNDCAFASLKSRCRPSWLRPLSSYISIAQLRWTRSTLSSRSRTRMSSRCDTGITSPHIPDFATRPSVREALDIAPDEEVIMFNGQIPNNTAVNALVAALCGILPDRPAAQLILVGAPEGGVLERQVPTLAQVERSRILLAERFVEVGELEVFDARGRYRDLSLRENPDHRVSDAGFGLWLALCRHDPRGSRTVECRSAVGSEGGCLGKRKSYEVPAGSERRRKAGRAFAEGAGRMTWPRSPPQSENICTSWQMLNCVREELGMDIGKPRC